MAVHPYERHILWKLALSEKSRYSELRPKDAESNLFIYHIKKLITEGLIKKLERGYCLTAQGQRYVDKLSLASFEPRFQPKIVTVIILKNPKGEYLFYTRKRQPFYGMLGFPYGKIHFGETIHEAAERELKEKTGLSAKLEHRGDVYLTIYNKDKELVADMLCHVFLGGNPSGKLLAETEVGSSSWEDIKTIGKKNFIPGFRQIFEITSKSKKYFFKEFTVSG